MAVLGATVVAVLIASAESLAEVKVVLVLWHIVTIIAIVRIVIGVATLIAETPTILPVGSSCVKTFLIPVVDRFAQQVGPIAIRFVIASAPPVSIVRSRIEVR